LATVDLVIKNGTIVTSSFHIEADIAVDHEKIVAISKNTRFTANTTVDAKGKYILPGMIDPHGHLHEPDVSKTDFKTGTTAAAAGGWTTILEMPISIPGVWNREILENRARLVEEKCLVDVALYAGGGVQNTDRVAELAEAGAIGYKTFMNEPIESRIEEFIGLWVTDSGRAQMSLKHLRLLRCGY